MWTIGHVSLGYLISRAGFGKSSIRPNALMAVFFIAFLPDFMHHGILLTLTHNLFFIIPFLIVIVWVFHKFEVITRSETIPVFIAGFTHILGDTLFGGFGFFYPFIPHDVGVLAWGSYLDLSVEICLFSVMMLFLILLGDLANVKRYLASNPRENKSQMAFQNFVIIALSMVFLGQICAIIYLDFFRGPNFYNQKVYHDGSMWYISVLFFIAYLIIVSLMLWWLTKRYEISKKIKKEY